MFYLNPFILLNYDYSFSLKGSVIFLLPLVSDQLSASAAKQVWISDLVSRRKKMVLEHLYMDLFLLLFHVMTHYIKFTNKKLKIYKHSENGHCVTKTFNSTSVNEWQI